MRLRNICLLAVIFMLFGCATAAKKDNSMELQQLQMKISDLENQIQQKDLTISDLGSELEKYQSQKKATGASDETGAIKLTAKNIQKALQSANFYTGPIDGKIGKQTRVSIKEFQKANGLTADGVVGKQTWLKLKQYLESNK